MDNPTDKPASDKPEGTDQGSSGLANLAHEELDHEPEPKAAEPAPSVPADMPAFGLAGRE